MTRISGASRNGFAIVIGAILAISLPSAILYYTVFKQAPAQDFLAFYAASRCVLDGHISLVMNDRALTAEMDRQFAFWLNQPYTLHPWLYPPTFLLLALPLGLIPPAISYVLFICSTFIGLAAAVRCFITKSSLRYLGALTLLLSPAAAFTIAVGQNAFLTTALLVGGFGLLQRNPLLAGAMLGILSVKPQLCLLIPVALAAGRSWKALLGAGISATLLVVGSVLTFGVGFWRTWLSLLIEPNQSFRDFIRLGQLNDQSAYTEAHMLGASNGVASLVQVMTTLACAILVWWCFRRSGLRRDLQLAVLLTSTILAAPHVANYDTIMVATAALLFLAFLLKRGFRYTDGILIVAVWAIELFNPPREFRIGLLTPLIYLVFLAALVRAGRGPPQTSPTQTSPPPTSPPQTSCQGGNPAAAEPGALAS